MTRERSDAIVATGITKSFGRHEVLRGLDIVAERGSMVAIVGENGSGKSTLLRILAGELRADAGSAEIPGRLGYCPQTSVLNERLTVGQHLVYFAAAYGLRSLDRADELVADLRFDGDRDRVVGELSGGTRQKLNLTVALMHDPDALLLDEPYQGFDWDTYLAFWDLVDGLRDRGIAIIVISHLVFEEGRFDAIYDLADGRAVRRLGAGKGTADARR